MFAVRLTSVLIGLLVSISAWSLDLRPDDVYQGQVHIGKHPKAACYVAVVSFNPTDSSYGLVVYKTNKSMGRYFQTHSYALNGFMSASGSTYYTKNSQGKWVSTANPVESLYVDLSGSAISSARIYGVKSNSKKVRTESTDLIVNCVDLKLQQRKAKCWI